MLESIPIKNFDYYIDLFDSFESDLATFSYISYLLKSHMSDQFSTNHCVGYRIYQSTADAYSLKAWLTKDAQIFQQDSFWRQQHLVYWEQNYKRVAKKLADAGLSIDNLQTAPKFMRPWLSFVKVRPTIAIIAKNSVVMITQSGLT